MGVHDPGWKRETVSAPATSEPTGPRWTTPARVGRVAPDFEAAAYMDGGFRNVKLSDYRGRWVLLMFYPGDFTFVCPTELTALAARATEFDRAGVAVLAISTDSRYVHKAWAEGELTRFTSSLLPYPLLADHGGAIGSVYGVYDETSGAELRGRFLIDPEGVVRSIEVLPPEVGRDVDEVLRQIAAFLHHEATGDLLPAGWRPGHVALQPAPEVLGRLWEVWDPGK